MLCRTFDGPQKVGMKQTRIFWVREQKKNNSRPGKGLAHSGRGWEGGVEIHKIWGYTCLAGRAVLQAHTQLAGPVSSTFRFFPEFDPFSSPPPHLLWSKSPLSLSPRVLCNSLPTHLLLPYVPPYGLSSAQEPDQSLFAVKDEPSPWPTWPSSPPHILYDLIFYCFPPPPPLHCSHTGLLTILPTHRTCPTSAFARPTPSTIQVFTKCHLPRDAFIGHSTL